MSKERILEIDKEIAALKQASEDVIQQRREMFLNAAVKLPEPRKVRSVSELLDIMRYYDMKLSFANMSIQEASKEKSDLISKEYNA